MTKPVAFVWMHQETLLCILVAIRFYARTVVTDSKKKPGTKYVQSAEIELGILSRCLIHEIYNKNIKIKRNKEYK